MFDWDALDAPKETVPALPAPTTASVENSNRGDLVFTKSWRCRWDSGDRPYILMVMIIMIGIHRLISYTQLLRASQ